MSPAWSLRRPLSSLCAPRWKLECGYGVGASGPARGGGGEQQSLSESNLNRAQPALCEYLRLGLGRGHHCQWHRDSTVTASGTLQHWQSRPGPGPGSHWHIPAPSLSLPSRWRPSLQSEHRAVTVTRLHRRDCPYSTTYSLRTIFKSVRPSGCGQRVNWIVDSSTGMVHQSAPVGLGQRRLRGDRSTHHWQCGQQH